MLLSCDVALQACCSLFALASVGITVYVVYVFASVELVQ